MLVSFIKNKNNESEIVCKYEIDENEYYHETTTHQFFIDSNLPLTKINSLCKKTNDTNLHDLFNYIAQDGALIVYDKLNGEITVKRDASGLSSVYYYKTSEELLFSTNVHTLAQLKKTPLIKSAIMQWLTFDFLWDGQVLYDTIEQVLMNQKLSFNKHFEIILNEYTPLSFKENENEYSEAENIKKLREEIVKAHKIYLREKNIVFLSGGIDSVAMLIALDDLVEKSKIENHSFKVKGTLEDETVYAKSIADFLKIDLKIIERDLTNEITLPILRDKVFSLNNPYSGIWIFANQVTKNKENIYFAGQDTRLHTPSLNLIDKIAFKFYSVTLKIRFLATLLNALMKPIQLLLEFVTKFNFFKRRIFKGIKRLSYITNTKNYILRYYFHQDENYYLGLKLPKEFYEVASKNYNIDLKNISSKRALYNYIVSVKWKEQYVNDIRYMIDMVKDQGGRLAMPFYNSQLAKFSATIPFAMANKSINGKGPFSEKKIKINKYVLRQSLRDKCDDKTYYRAKAVSNTGHIIYNQVLTKLLRKILIDDISHPHSLISQLNLQQFIQQFQTQNKPFEVKDAQYLLKIYYLCCIIIYASVSDNKLV